MKELINWLEDNGFDFMHGIQNDITYKGKDCFLQITQSIFGIYLTFSSINKELCTDTYYASQEHLLISAVKSAYKKFQDGI